MHFAAQIPQVTGCSGQLDLMDHPLGARSVAVVQKRFKVLLDGRQRQAMTDSLSVNEPVPETRKNTSKNMFHF